MRGVVVLTVACAAGPASEPVPATPPQPSPAPPRVVAARVAPPPAAAVIVEPKPVPPYPARVTSVRFIKDAPIHAEPGETGKKIGTGIYGARVVARDARPRGDGCERRWIQIEPRGWVCETMLSPSSEPPTVAERVSLHDTGWPKMGVYGVVAKGTLAYDNAEAIAAHDGHAVGLHTTVRGGGLTEVDGTKYWITTDGQMIDASAIDVIAPSHFHGTPIDDGTLHVAWARSHETPDVRIPPPVVLRGGPSRDAPEVGKIPHQSELDVLDQSADGTFVRLDDGTWVAREDVRMPTLATPPEGAGEHDHWFDVDLDEQVLVAYEGTRPVYATLVSTGKRFRDTPAEVAHVKEKHLLADMNSDLVDVYSVAQVPWTMFYDRNFALHAAYWHDEFGDVHSHGCVNLSPRDARVLFDWAEPALPPGWSSIYDDEQHGSIVRIRSKAR